MTKNLSKWIASIIFFVISLFGVNWDELHMDTLSYIHRHPIISHLSALPTFVFGLFGGR
jgi:hypothetical protein